MNSSLANHLHELTANGAIIHLANNVLTFVYEENIFDPAVLHQHRFGQVEYGLVQRHRIPVILIGFG